MVNYFTLHGDVNNHVFKSPFFIVESVYEKNHSAIFDIFLPYPMFILKTTESILYRNFYVQVNL